MKKRTLSLLLAGAMLLSVLSGCEASNPSPESEDPDPAMTLVTETGDYPITPDGADVAAKWTEEKTSDGWVKVTNEDGETLGYSPDSGLKIIQVDGLAFKDLNRNGQLDMYEDWRQPDDERAADLASQMDVMDILPLTLHLNLGSIEADGSDAGFRDADYMFSDKIMEGSHVGLMRSIGDTKIYTTWINNMEKVGESTKYGIPVSVSANPALADAYANSLAATMDSEKVGHIYDLCSQMYRALGITTILGPQADMSSEPRWNRINGTFGEDPALISDMINASVSALQSTYDANGNDLGWGKDSVIGMIKHFPGDGPGESGRESHSQSGKYTVYPGDSFEISLIPFFDAGLNLDSKTGQSAAIMLSYSIAYSDTEEYGDLVGSAFSEWKINLLRDYGYDGLICSDWGITTDFDPNSLSTPWGYEDSDRDSRAAAALVAGTDQIGGLNEMDYDVVYSKMVEALGQEGADARLRDAARHIVKTYFLVGLFENPYVDVKHAVSVVDELKEETAQIYSDTIVMLKNADNTIKAADGEKKTAYVPMVYTAARGGGGTWGLPANQAVLDASYNVVTDTVDAEGNVVRASGADIADCDMALIFVTSPTNAGAEVGGYGHDNETDEYFPISLQYGEYTANSADVRTESISGNMVEVTVESIYGDVASMEKENRSYYGKSSRMTNANELELIKDVVSAMPNGKVVVCVSATNPMVFSEFEEDVDAILIGFGVGKDAFIPVVSGEIEPSGLLPLQMPASMEAVEAQLEDVPRDMECYTDSQGNTYDFTFGLNWSGKISDSRVSTYDVPALTTLINNPLK